MRILLSAYSCEPNRGSEPGLGWHTAAELSREHDVWVVTKQRHRAAIEKELALHPRPRLHVVCYEPAFPLNWVARFSSLGQFHYYLWQYGVYPLALKLHRQVQFDVASHVSYGRIWSPSLFSFLPIPFVWSGVGGGEVVAPSMRSTLGIRDRLVEHVKERIFSLYRIDPLVRETARRSALILANNSVTAHKLSTVTRSRIEFMDTAVVDQNTVSLIAALDEPAPRHAGDPVCFATLTRLVSWKGVHLGLQAFHRLGNPQARYLIVGEGPERPRLQRMARDLGIDTQVEFLGSRTRAEWMQILKQCHAMIHPSLASAFNTIVLEAMLCKRPVITFHSDYMASRLGHDTTYFVDGSSPHNAVDALAQAMQAVVTDPDDARARGIRGEVRALEQFTWEPRIRRLKQLLEEVALRPTAGSPG